jgi:hypothetical protein
VIGAWRANLRDGIGCPFEGFGARPKPSGQHHAAILTDAGDAGLPFVVGSAAAAAASRLACNLGTMNP